MTARMLNIAAVLLITASALPAPGAADDADAGTAGREDGARVSIGVSLDYAWWNPVWGTVSQAGDMLIYALINRGGPYIKLEDRSRAYEVRPAPLFGISCDARIARGWGLSASAGAGTYRDSSVMVASITTNPFSPSEYMRYRIDTVNFGGSLLATYRPAEWAMLTLGPVYQGCVLRERNSSYLSTQSGKETIHNAGISAGASFDVRLAGDLFLKPSVSFLYLYGTVTGNPAISSRRHSHALGGAANMMLAYFIRKIRVTFALGFSCQALRYLEVTNTDYLNRWDSRYGLTESITYTF